MSLYRYSPLLGANSIRLLRLMPDGDESAAIRCQLFDYALDTSRKGIHLYEALSYAWGDPHKTHSVSIDNTTLAITSNLHAALLQLRDPLLERILWVDAVSINQDDIVERGEQIRLMAKIYGLASRVLVWLGEASDSSDQAIESIQLAAEADLSDLPTMNINKESVLSLFKRPWFRRIWVLQEVAAARNILVLCGQAMIDGHAFSIGSHQLLAQYEDLRSIKNLVRSTTYLMEQAAIRTRTTAWWANRTSLDICSIGELTDMYHSHKASVRHDKIFALLGMSCKDERVSELATDYQVPWEELLQQLVRVIMHPEVSVETWADREVAVIRCSGYAICRVAELEALTLRVKTSISSTQEAAFPEFKDYIPPRQDQACPNDAGEPSARTILPDDLICVFEGCSAASIVRPGWDYFEVIRITFKMSSDVPHEDLKAHIAKFPEMLSHEFLLVWDWEDSDGTGPYQEESRTFLNKRGKCASLSLQDEANSLEEVNRLLNTSLAMTRVCSEQVLERLRAAIGRHLESPYNAQVIPNSISTENSILPYVTENRLHAEVIELFKQAISAINPVQGMVHPSTIDSMIRLAHILFCTPLIDWKDTLDVLQLVQRILLLPTRKISLNRMGFWPRAWWKGILVPLIEAKGAQIVLTPSLLNVAADVGVETLAALYESMGTGVHRIEEALLAALVSPKQQILWTLFDCKQNEIHITEKLVKAIDDVCQKSSYALKISRTFIYAMVETILDRNINEISLSQDFLMTFVSDDWWEPESYVFKRLLSHPARRLNIIHMAENDDLIKKAATYGRTSIVEALEGYSSSSKYEFWIKVAQLHYRSRGGVIGMSYVL